jgi:hypothetical protein
MPAKYLGLYMGRSVICSPYGLALVRLLLFLCAVDWLQCLALATLWAFGLVCCSPMVFIREYPYKNIFILLLYICGNLFYTYHINKRKGLK